MLVSPRSGSVQQGNQLRAQKACAGRRKATPVILVVRLRENTMEQSLKLLVISAAMLVTYAPAYSETPESSTVEQYEAEARKRLEVIDSQGGIDRNEAKEISQL